MRKRHYFTAEQKAELLRRHLVDKVPVSQICNENELQPSVFQEWLTQLMALAPNVLASSREPAPDKKLAKRVAELEEKLKKKDGVIADLSEEMIKLKKELGEL